jgi:hypothetical protein
MAITPPSLSFLLPDNFTTSRKGQGITVTSFQKIAVPPYGESCLLSLYANPVYHVYSPFLKGY